LSNEASGSSMPSACGASRRIATWAASGRPTVIPRKGPTLVGMGLSSGNEASRYAPTTNMDPSTSSPSSVVRLDA
jgi:hypothetical protein